MNPGKMVPEKWSPGKIVHGKMVPGKMVPEKNGPRKNGPREKWFPGAQAKTRQQIFVDSFSVLQFGTYVGS